MKYLTMFPLFLLFFSVHGSEPVVIDQQTTITNQGVVGQSELESFLSFRDDTAVLDLGDRPLILADGATLVFETQAFVLAQSLELSAAASVQGQGFPLELRVVDDVDLQGQIETGHRFDLTSLSGSITSGPTSRLELDAAGRGAEQVRLTACQGAISLRGLLHIYQTDGAASSIYLNAGTDLTVDGQEYFGSQSGRELYGGVRVLAGENGQAGLIHMEAGGNLRVNGYGYLPDHGETVTYTGLIPISGDHVPVTLTLTQGASAGQVDGVVSIPEGEGDILGLFGNITDESLLNAMSASGDDVTDSAFNGDKIKQLGGGNNVNPVRNWDWALRFGAAGSAGGGITQTAFTLSGPDLTLGHVTRALNEGWLFGVRIQSTNGGEGSSKMGLAGPEAFDPARHYGTVVVATLTGGGTIQAQALSGDLVAYDQAFRNNNPDNGAAQTVLEAGVDLLLATTGSVDGSDPTEVVVDTSDPSNSRQGAAGSNRLVAHAGKLDIGAAARVLAEAGKGSAGSNQFQACTELADASLASPSAQGEIVCGTTPQTLFPADLPQWTSTPLTQIDEGQTWDYVAQAQNAHGNGVIYSLLAGPDGMTIDAYSGALQWTPGARDAGTHGVAIQADVGCFNDQQFFDIIVNEALNVDPEFEEPLPGLTARACELYEQTVVVRDDDGDSLTFTLNQAPDGMTVTSAGTLRFTPTSEQVGVHPVELLAEDGRGGSALLSFDLEILAPELSEFTSSPSLSGNEEEVYSYQPVLQVPTGRSLSFSLLEGPETMTIDASSGLISWTPTAIQAGDYPVRLRADDGCQPAEQAFVLQIQDTVNVPPVITSLPPGDAVACEGYRYQLSAEDGDGDALAYELLTGPEGLVQDGNELRWEPSTDQQGVHTVSWRVVDRRGGLAQQDFQITVAPPTNQPPSFTSSPITETVEDQLWQYRAQAVDPEGSAVTYTLVNAPAGVSLDSASGLLSWTPAEPGDYEITIHAVSDGCGFGVQGFTLTVLVGNLPPEITSTAPDRGTVGQAYSYPVTAVDPEGEALVYSLDAAPAGMTIEATTGAISWTPSATQVNASTATVRATDPHGLYDTQVFNIHVNGAPYFTSDPVTSVEVLNPYSYSLTAADPNPGDALTYQLVSGPAGLHLNGDRLLWVPDEDQVGDNPVELTVTDQDGLQGQQSFVINVTADINRPPRITSTPETVHLLIPAAGAGEPINLTDWEVIHYPQNQGPPDWRIEDGGYSAIQRRNADASILLSDFSMVNAQIEGKFKVETYSDDDLIGFMIYVSREKFYLFDWKAGTQSTALRGMTLKAYDLEPGDSFGFWSTYSSKHETLYHNSIPWRDFVEYDFSLDFHPGEISITVSETDSGKVLDSFTIYDDTHLTGRFGFYNRSQERVRYRGFTREVLADREYTYAPTAVDPDDDVLSWYLLEGPEGLVMDVESGALSWLTNTTQVGSYPITIRVVDEHGLYDDQSYTLIVENEAPVITSDPITQARVDALYIYDVAAIDPTPGDTLSYSLGEGPSGMTIPFLCFGGKQLKTD